MSDTPRTDAFEKKLDREFHPSDQSSAIWEYARDLERELAAANAELYRYRQDEAERDQKYEERLRSVAPEVERSEVIEECARVVESAPGGAALTKHNAYMATVLRGLKVREPQHDEGKS